MDNYTQIFPRRINSLRMRFATETIDYALYDYEGSYIITAPSLVATHPEVLRFSIPVSRRRGRKEHSTNISHNNDNYEVIASAKFLPHRFRDDEKVQIAKNSVCIINYQQIIDFHGRQVRGNEAAMVDGVLYLVLDAGEEISLSAGEDGDYGMAEPKKHKELLIFKSVTAPVAFEKKGWMAELPVQSKKLRVICTCHPSAESWQRGTEETFYLLNQ